MHPFVGTKRSELATIQIATENTVYILDVTTIGGDLKESWRALSLLLFDNKSIIKLGTFSNLQLIVYFYRT